ncbi:MAG: hypothetical protein HKN91_04395 [Acidimicrobiia bacterium]|nr:hypothetical protein [Acidimicrobiia bacterium]
MSEDSHEVAGESRRDFLKKAGKVAWVVPTIQVVNMAAAAAGVEGSMVTSTSTSTTTTTTTTTTEPPECTEECTIKADWTGQGYAWSDGGLGAQPCVTVTDNKCDGGGLGFSWNGDEREVTVTAPGDCKILEAAHKAGSQQQGDACTSAMIGGGGSYAIFRAGDDGRDISNIQMVVCCLDVE